MNINQSESTVELTNLSPPYFLFGTDVDEKSSSEQFLLSIYDSVQASIFVVDVQEDGDFRYVALNPTHERWIGMRSEDLKGKKPEDILSPVDAARVRQHYTDCVRFGKTISYEQCLQFQGKRTWWSTTLTPLRDANAKIYRLIGTSSNITPPKKVERSGRLQQQGSNLLEALAQQIRHSEDLDIILPQTVKQIRQILQCDRVLIYRFGTDGTGVVVAESTVIATGPLLGKNIDDPCFTNQHQQSYTRGGIEVVEDIYAPGLHPCQRDFLASLQVRANLAVPILLKQDLWGLLITQHCQEPRQWQHSEIDLLNQLATQLSISVLQAELHQQVQHLKAQMQQTHNFQALVQRITEKIRDNLDATQILQTVIQELVQLLKLESCQIELYSSNCTLATVAYEYCASLPPSQGLVTEVANFPDMYQPLLQKQTRQTVEIVPRWHPKLLIVTQIACPIFDAQGILGNLWLIRPTQETFEEAEIGLLQQVANQCAIAIRRGKLYDTTQAQDRDLETGEHLKNEFLRTLSQELRTPITSISLAAQTLESLLTANKALDRELVSQLLQILQNECGRGSKLIHDLLALTHIETKPDPQTLIVIDLQTWLPPIVESFREVTACQRQELTLNIETALPALETDITDLERVVTELLSHVCKYTPVGESITVSAHLTADNLQMSFRNSGLEIPANQLSRIFEPFYRLSKNDPWKSSGTGLELALVKKMVQHLGGSIYVESVAGQTTFIVELPI
ncbi:MAG: GAF domain-containing protein [Gloeotrichia echinulata IR180]